MMQTTLNTAFERRIWYSGNGEYRKTADYKEMLHHLDRLLELLPLLSPAVSPCFLRPLRRCLVLVS
jgi:hypothetical protein